MRARLGSIFALALLLSGAGFSPGQKVLEENPYYLRSDPRLQVSLNVEAEHPKLPKIIAKLHDATGLDIAIDPSLHDHEPDYGIIQPSKNGYHAWQIMEMVAQRDLQQGYWEKTEGGYRLTGTSVAVHGLPPGPPGGISGNLRFWLTGGSLLLFALVMCRIVYHWLWKRGHGSQSPDAGGFAQEFSDLNQK